MSVVCETQRLVVRPLTVDDAPFIWELLNDADFLAFIGDRGVRTVDDAVGYLTNGPLEMYARLGHGLWRVELKATQTPIGMCGLLKREWLDDVDLGYALLPEFRGRGYAREAAAAVLTYALDTLALVRVAAIVSPENVRSTAVLEGLGMRFQSMVRLPTATSDLHVYSIGIGQE